MAVFKVALVNGDAALRCCVLFADNALELLGYVGHESLIERNAGVKLSGGTCESVVGISAGGEEVVGDNGVGRFRIKVLAVDAVDGHAVDALGSVVGGAGIGIVVCVVGYGDGNGHLDAGYLGEAAEGYGSAVGGSLESLVKLSAGHINDRDGVAEGQNGVDVLLGDVALGNGCADAAAVGDGNDVLFGNGDAVKVFLDLPHHGIGDEVAEVGLAVAVAVYAVFVNGPCAVEVNLALCEHNAVLGIDLVDDGLCRCCDCHVRRGLCGDLNELVALDRLLLVIDHDNADIFE